MAAEATSLDEYPLDGTDGQETVRLVADRLAAYRRRSRGDRHGRLGARRHGHRGLFSDISRAIDKHLWFVETHLNGEA